MASIAISASSSVIVDGNTFTNGGSFVAEVDTVVETTVQAGTSYVVVSLSGATQKPSFIAVFNNGSEDGTVRMKLAAVVDYVFCAVPQGGCIVIPCAASTNTTAAFTRFEEIAAAADTGSTRMLFIIGFHA